MLRPICVRLSADRRSGRFVTAMALLGLLAFAPSASADGDRELGQYLASECTSCHQVTGQYAGIPPIIGWPPSTFIEIMSEYRQKKRDNPVMQMIAARLTDDETAALAAYFGSLKPQPSTTSN